MSPSNLASPADAPTTEARVPEAPSAAPDTASAPASGGDGASERTAPVATPSAPRRKKKPTNCFRIDTRTTHGWQVRFRRQGQTHSKFFSDKKHGGPDGALEAAVAHRDAVKGELPPKMDPNEARGRKSETGVRGLSVNMNDIGNGTKKPYVSVSAVVGGERKASSFSIEKWGWRRALWKACKRLGTWRRMSTAEIQRIFTRATEHIDRSKYPVSDDD
jgi:hypothetical protein